MAETNRPFDREITACFTGHRDPDPEDIPFLPFLIRKSVTDAYLEGYRVFECGGARGFDLMAARETLALKKKYPDLKLWLVLPCGKRSVGWSSSVKEEYESIAAKADRVDVLSERYYQGCMLTRDRFMVAHASRCICYLKHSRGGTLYTVACAVRSGLETVNLAMESGTENVLKEKSWNYTFTSPSASENADTAILLHFPAVKRVFRPISVYCSAKLKSGVPKSTKK